MRNYMLVGRLANGSTVYYTGRAGAGWVSPNISEAFTYFSLEGARRRATNHNKFTSLHGVLFHVPCGEYQHEELIARGQVQPIAEEI